jgi:hypothetical protein
MKTLALLLVLLTTSCFALEEETQSSNQEMKELVEGYNNPEFRKMAEDDLFTKVEALWGWSDKNK